MKRRRGAATLFEVPDYSDALREDMELVTQFFLDLRGVGHFPSPQDSQLITDWCTAGAPVDVILRGIHEGAKTSQGKGEPLRSLGAARRAVDKEIKHYLSLNIAVQRNVSQETPEEDPSSPELIQQQKAFLRQHFDRLKALRAQAVENGESAWIELCDKIGHRLKVVDPQKKKTALVISELTGAGRQFYDGVLDLLGHEARQGLRGQAEAQLQGWIRPMSEEAREETLREYEVCFLRDRLSLFVPAQVFELWGP